MWKKIIIGIAVLAVAFFLFATWYKFHYSMDIAKSFEVNTPDLKHRVLIATQGSEFKDAVVTGLVDHLKQGQTYIKVIDVSALSQINGDDWHAVVLIHTWENWEPQPDAKAYIGRVKDLNKLIVLTTSGRGDFKMEGINAITSASVMSDIPAIVSDINKRIESILNGGSK